MNCPKCGLEIKETWKVCPECATPIEKNIVKPLELQPNDKPSNNIRLTPVGRFSLIIAGILLFILFVTQLNTNNTPANNNNKSVPAAVQAPAPPTKVENWQYEEREDKINNAKFKIARCQSANTFDFKFPYGGSQHAYLVVRQNYDGTKDVMIRIEKGQFMVSVLGGKALVRFDDNKPESYSLLPTADGTSTVVFIKYADAFISALEKSKKIYFQTDIYQEGNPTMEFNVEGFKVP